MTIFLVACAVAVLTLPAGYAVGSIVALGKSQDNEQAYARLSWGVRQFVLAHLPPDYGPREAVVRAADLAELGELAAECDDLAGLNRRAGPEPLRPCRVCQAA
jgi:hypothetical protein